GMRVTDDITLLLCDDNWGNIRKLPKLDEKPRRGGYGIYYHYDYVGGPRNYKWLNTNQISRVWEQMHLAYEYGAVEIWIVNVGDIKPMEFPISFFLDYAWDPANWPAERLPEYTRLWAKEQFGAQYSEEIAHLLTQYTRYNSRRKPELLSPDTYSLQHYREAETIVAEYNALSEKGRAIYDALPGEYRDAFYQLVLHPIEACANLNDLYVTVARNRLYARQGRAATNNLADKARQLYDRDAQITEYYNNTLAAGKWSHMMDQTHIGYTYWQQPDENAMPQVHQIRLPRAAGMGVQVEGSDACWPDTASLARLPLLDRYHQQQVYIEVFNRGKKAFNFSARPAQDWVQVHPKKGKIKTETRLWVSVDWEQAPPGIHTVPITITGPGDEQVEVQAGIQNPDVPAQDLQNRFLESDGYISIEAAHYSRAVNKDPIAWQRIPNLGRTLSAMTPFPVTAPTVSIEEDSPRLEYQLYLFRQGEVQVTAYLSPTQDFDNDQQLRYGISFDNETPQIINMHADKTFQDWEESVRNNVTIEVSNHTIDEPGQHVLKFWMVDPGLVLQKLVIDTGNAKPCYLGPPESFHMAAQADH
ncbi:MAG: glycosyl hydrolase 115 family protein, partial [Fidelibacterota bacterium]